MGRYLIETGGGAFKIDVNGRDEWALLALNAVGKKGCTPIETPGPRWSGYVHNLRKMGVDIETRMERHKGPYPGHHARYILHSKVMPVEVTHAA